MYESSDGTYVVEHPVAIGPLRGDGDHASVDSLAR